MPHRGNFLISPYQTSMYSGPWAPASPRVYQPPVYNPWKVATPRPYYPQAPPPTTSYSKSRSHESRSSCLSTMNPTLEMVLKKAITKENENRGKHKAEIVKSISNSDVKHCRECVGNECTSFKNVELAMTIAPACRTKSKDCICGVDRSYPKRLCTVSAKVHPHKGVYDLLIFCERRLPTAEIKAWRRKQKVEAKRLRKLKKAKRAKRRRRKRRRFKSKKLKRRPPKLRNTPRRKGNEISEEIDSSAEGPDRQKPAPIVLWDETASQATIVIPKRSVDKLVNGKGIY